MGQLLCFATKLRYVDFVRNLAHSDQEYQLRKNCAFERKVFDLNDRLAVDTRAVGAHNDVTRSSGPRMISTRMPEHARSEFLKPGYRYRIVKLVAIPILHHRRLTFLIAPGEVW